MYPDFFKTALMVVAMLLGIDCKHIAYLNKGLTSIPLSTDPSCKSLAIRGNTILNLTNNSLITYPKLVKLDLTKNRIKYIMDGAFNGLKFLQQLNLVLNRISYLPASFGPPTKSLIKLHLWDAFNQKARLSVSHPYFSEFVNLTSLNVGYIYAARHIFNGSLLPRGLKYINLAYAGLIELPDFSSYAPNLKSVNVYRNPMKYMPSMYLKGMFNMKQLDIKYNKLTTVPDLYHLNLTRLRLAGNPVECNQSLCWLRMWPWMKPSVLKDKPICAAPPFLHGIPLMEVGPTDIQCYKGKSVTDSTHILHLLEIGG